MATKTYPQRRSLRLANYDYSQAGVYFVTLCTQNRLCLFGNISDGRVLLNDAGRMVENCWLSQTDIIPNLDLDAFIVVPNHLHGLLILPDAPEQPITAPDIVRRFKTYTTNQYITGVKVSGWPRFDKQLWQRSYHDRVVRNERELDAIREYIVYNALRWELDQENPDHS